MSAEQLSESTRFKRVVKNVGASLKGFFSRQGFANRWHELVVVLATLSGIASGLVDDLPDIWGWSLLALSGVLLVVAWFRSADIQAKRDQEAQSRDQEIKSIEALRSQIAQLEEKELARRWDFRENVLQSLRELCASVNAWNSHTRASCYTHNGGAFVQFGRVSDNPALRVSGRGIYPDDEGIISVAWRDQEDCWTGIDDPDDPVCHSEKYNVPEETVLGFTMKSKSYIAARIADNANGTDKHIGVIVVESTQKRGVNRAMLRKLQASPQWVAFQKQIATSREYLPDTAELAGKGF